MDYFCIVLYSIVSFLMLYNISAIISLLTNSKAKFNFSLLSFLYIVCSSIYFFHQMNPDYISIDFILLLILKYILLFLCICKTCLQCKLIEIIYIYILYLLLDSILNSMFQFIISMFYENYTSPIVETAISILSCIVILIFINIIKRKKTICIFRQILYPNMYTY